MDNNMPDDWSRLTSSSKFDPGNAFAKKKIVPKSQTLSRSLVVESLIELLSRFIESDPKRRRKTVRAICSQLRDMNIVGDTFLQEELAGLRAHFGEALTSMIHRPQLKMPLLETSRFATEFHEISWIASGGFGHVFRARHRLDEMEYAVKKIRVRFKDMGIYERTMGEVKTLARLNHPNIVQYKAAWLEANTMPQRRAPALRDAADDSSDQCSNEEDDSNSTSSDDSLAVCAVTKEECPQLLANGAALYVCMQLCDETLRQWLDRRNSTKNTVDPSLALRLLQQAVKGVAYIHSSNVVHHDIKPSNVFITDDLRVQVGDFGLACALGGGECPVRAGHGGTRLYAAPEQLRRQCHLRSDIYSLGLVLIEMLCPFTTDMERASVLGKARKGELPTYLSLPVQDLLEEMLAINPNKRPNAVDLVNELNDLQLTFTTREFSEHVQSNIGHNISEISDHLEYDNGVDDNTRLENTDTTSTSTHCVPTSREDDVHFIQTNTINKLKADLRRITAVSYETINNLREIDAENKKTIERLRKTESSNDDTITQLRKMLEERDIEIIQLRQRLSLKNNNNFSCAEQYRTHST